MGEDRLRSHPRSTIRNWDAILRHSLTIKLKHYPVDPLRAPCNYEDSEEGSSMPERQSQHTSERGYGRYNLVWMSKTGASVHLAVMIEEAHFAGKQISLTIRDDRNVQRYITTAQITECTDLATGEILPDAYTHFRQAILEQVTRTRGGVTLANMIDSLPIEQVGPSMSDLLARAFGTWDLFVDGCRAAAREWRDAESLRATWGNDAFGVLCNDRVRDKYMFASEPQRQMPRLADYPAIEALLLIEGVGPVTAQQLVDAGDALPFEALAADYSALSYNVPSRRSGTLARETIVFTGTLAHMTRAAAQAAAESAGARVEINVTAMSSALVVGNEPSAAKLKKARTRNIRILDESQFLALIGKQ